jgi:transcriptional regulator with XRE-family HTH domain
MDAEQRRAIGRRIRMIRERLGWDRHRFADQLGVHWNSVARWEIGGSVPRDYHLEQIAGLGGTTLERLRAGADGARPHGAEPEGEELFAFFDQVVRFLGGIAPPGQERLRKLDALEGLRRMLTTRGVLPGWWYELRDRVEADEL